MAVPLYQHELKLCITLFISHLFCFLCHQTAILTVSRNVIAFMCKPSPNVMLPAGIANVPHDNNAHTHLANNRNGINWGVKSRPKHTDAATFWMIVIESFLDFETPLSFFPCYPAFLWPPPPPWCFFAIVLWCSNDSPEASPLSTFLIRSATTTLLCIHLHVVFSRPLCSYLSACRPRALWVHPRVSCFPEPPGNTFVLVFRSPSASPASSWRLVLWARRSLCVQLVFQHACFSVFTDAALLLTPVASASHLSVPLHIDFSTQSPPVVLI